MSSAARASVGLKDCELVIKAAIAERNRDYLLRAAIAFTMGILFAVVMAFLLFMCLLLFLGQKWSAIIVGSLAAGGLLAAIRGQDPIEDPFDMSVPRFKIASTARVPIEPFALMLEALRLVRSRIKANSSMLQNATVLLHDAFASPQGVPATDEFAATLLVRLQLAKQANPSHGYELTMRARERLLRS